MTQQVWEYTPAAGGDGLARLVTEKGRSIVMTNPRMAQHLVQHMDFPKDWTILEPCRGDGAFTNALTEAGYANKYCEINEGSDFLTYEGGMVDAIISNPPFIPRKLFWDFHCKAMAVSRHSISWLINIISLNVFTPVRLLEIQSRGWYVQKLHVVADKRWFGRYVLMTFSREPSDVLTSHRETF